VIEARGLIVKASDPQFTQMDDIVRKLRVFTNDLSDPLQVHWHTAEQPIELGHICRQIEDLIENVRQDLTPRVIRLGLGD